MTLDPRALGVGGFWDGRGPTRLSLKQARERYRQEFEGAGEAMKFQVWLRQWWPDFFTPDAQLRRILGKDHPNVVLGDQRRAAATRIDCRFGCGNSRPLLDAKENGWLCRNGRWECPGGDCVERL